MGVAALPIGMAALGGLKYEMVDKPKEQRQRKLDSQLNYYDKLTGDNSGANAAVSSMPEQGSLANSLLSGAGAGMQQNDNNSWKSIMEKMMQKKPEDTDQANPIQSVYGSGGGSWGSLMGAGGVPVLPA